MHHLLADLASALGQDEQLEQLLITSKHTEKLPFMSMLDVHSFGVVPMPLTQQFVKHVGARAQLSVALTMDTELSIALALTHVWRVPSEEFSFRHSA